MKFITLTFTALLIVCTVHAQTFVYSTDQHVVAEEFTSSFVDYDIKFKTTTPQEITYEWERITNTLPVEWTYSLCDYGACYPGVPANGVMSTITLVEAQAGEQGFFKLTLNPAGVPGEGLVQLYVYDGADYNVGDTVSYHITYSDTSTATGIEVLQANQFRLYPNPAKEQVNIATGSNSEAYTLRLFDATGRLLMETQAVKTALYTLSLNELDSGIYMISLQSASGSIHTKRLIIQ